MTKIPHDDILEGLYKLRIREFEKLKTVLELYDLETHQKKLGPDCHKLKSMVKRRIEQEIRNKNFGARTGNFEKNAVVKNQGTKQTKIPRSVTFVQVNLMSVAPTLRNLRIVHKKRQSGKSKVPVKQRGSWPKICLKRSKSSILLVSGKQVCLLASILKLEEREFVVDSGASMHMISKKDLSES